MADYKDLPPLIASPTLVAKVGIAIDLKIQAYVAEFGNTPVPGTPHISESHVQAWCRLAYVQRDVIRRHVTGAVIIENRAATPQQIVDASDMVIRNQVATIIDKFLSKQLWPTQSVPTRDTSAEGLST